MKKINVYFTVISLFFLYCTAFAGNNSAAHTGGAFPSGEYVQGQFIVGFKKNVLSQRIGQITAAENISLIKKISGINGFLISVAQGWGTGAYIKYFREKYSGLIEFAGPNNIFHVNYTPYTWPDDPYYTGASPNDQWNINQIQADLAWNTTTGGMSSFSRGNTVTVIAIIDSGISATHEELAGKLVGGWNCIDESTDTADNLGHGTNVAGIAAAATDNLKGIAGTAPNVMLMPVKITESGAATEADIAEGVAWAADHGAGAANISLSGTGYPAALEAACNYAYYDKGMFIASSAGNGGGYFAARYPAAFSSVMAVGSTDKTDERAGFSNYGDFLEVNAPGDSIAATDRSSDTAIIYTSATSFSVPIVAGFAAVLMSNSVTNYEAVSRIARTCDKTGATAYSTTKDLGTWNQNMGYGRVNFYRCMKTLVPPGNITVLDNTLMVSLNWSGPSLHDTATAGYYIYRSTAPDGPFTRLNTAPYASLYYDDMDVTEGSTYYYYIKAVDMNGFETRPDSTVSTTVVGFPTKTPTKTCTPPANTPTEAPTPGQTGTFTATQSVTPESTPAWSDTATPVFTFTETAESTADATPAQTASETPAETATSTCTETSTVLSTATIGNTSTVTVVATWTPALTETATATPIPTAMATATATTSAVEPGSNLEFTNGGEPVMYPNPSIRGQDILKIGFTLSAGAGHVRMRVYTIGFRLVIQKDFYGIFGPGAGYVVLDSPGLEHLTAGIYYIKLLADDGQTTAMSKIGKAVIF